MKTHQVEFDKTSAQGCAALAAFIGGLNAAGVPFELRDRGEYVQIFISTGF